MLVLRIKKWVAYVGILAILPGFSHSNDLVLQKTSRLMMDKGSIEYTLQTFKKNMNRYEGIPVLKDQFSRHTQLRSFSQTPSAYYIQHHRHEGYPFSSQFHEVSALEWKLQPCQRYRHPQEFFIANNDGGVRLRNDILHLPEITVAWKKNYTYGAVAPVAEVVEDRKMIFSATMDGFIRAIYPVTGALLWEYELPAGEIIEKPMNTVQEQKRTLLTAVSNRGNLYVLLASSGSLVGTKSLGPSLSAPLYGVKYNNHHYLIVVTAPVITCIQLSPFKIVWQREQEGSITRSPFSMRIGREKWIFTTSREGIITAIDFKGNTIWQRSAQDRLPFGASGFVYQAVPYIAGVGESGHAFLLHAGEGTVLSRITLPGRPRSDMSIHASALSFALVCDDPFTEDQSIFFSSEFFPQSRLPGRITLPGKKFLGPIGVRMDDETWYYVVDSQQQLWMLQHGSIRPLQGYPYSLDFMESSFYPHLEGGLVLTEYALYAAFPGAGLYAIGMPEASTVDRSFVSLKSQQHRHSSYRNDMDQMPSPDIRQIIPANLSFPDHERPFAEPAVFFHREHRTPYIVQADSNGDLNFYNQQGEVSFQLMTGSGPVLVAPQFDYISSREVRIYILGAHQLQAWLWDPTNHQLEKIWERRDLKSSGSTFMLTELKQGERLFFVDERKFFTSVCAKSGETIFREVVDAWQFAYYLIYTQPLIFCGSRKIDAISGRVLSRPFIRNSHSSMVGVAGRVYLFQSNDRYMKAFDAHSHEVIWRVQKLWCRKYCFQQTSPAVLYKGYHAWVYWPDYQRMLCIDVLRGFIMWRERLTDDYFLASPAIAETIFEPVVFAGTIKGRLFAWNVHSQINLKGFPMDLPGRISPREELKGCSTPLLLNGSLLIYRRETGLIQLGEIRENSRALDKIFFEVTPREEQEKRKIFNRAQLKWDGKIFFSNITNN